QVQSLVYRLPGDPAHAPLVALVQLERATERKTQRSLARARGERERSEARVQLQHRWLGVIADVAELFRREGGPTLLQATAETLVRRLSALDAGVAVYMGGELALGSSTRGMLGPRMV